jgi:hypothetical protein
VVKAFRIGGANQQYSTTQGEEIQNSNRLFVSPVAKQYRDEIERSGPLASNGVEPLETLIASTLELPTNARDRRPLFLACFPDNEHDRFDTTSWLDRTFLVESVYVPVVVPTLANSCCLAPISDLVRSDI